MRRDPPMEQIHDVRRDLRAAAQRREELGKAYARKAERYRQEARQMRRAAARIGRGKNASSC
jgi:hypothetical protein